MSLVREIGGEFAILWTTIGRTLRRKGAQILLLFVFAWLAYYVTAALAGLIAPRLAWVVIPLMAGGCLVILTVTLAAYRMSIEEAQVVIDAPKLDHLSLSPLISTLLVPFMLAYSAFGFFEGFARTTMFAAATMTGTTSESSFLGLVDPTASSLTLILCAGAFIVMWVLARVLKYISEKRESLTISLTSALFSSSAVFLVLFSVFRLFGKITTWVKTRTFVGWSDALLERIGSIFQFDFPVYLRVAWNWFMENLWPIFWYALSQPILWLVVVALIGGMQFHSVESVWMRLIAKIPVKSSAKLSLPKVALTALQELAESLLCFLHMLSAVLKSGAPFLAALVISFAVIEQAGEWLEYLIALLLGPSTTQNMFLTSPIAEIFSQLFTPALQAVILATAFVRLRQIESARALSPYTILSPHTRITWKPLISMILIVGLAAGIYTVKPPGDEHFVTITPGVTTQVDTMNVTITDMRIGRSIEGMIDGKTWDDPIPSHGVFVIVNVTLGCELTTGISIEGRVGDSIYQPWDSSAGSLRCAPGFSASQDFAFEIPSEDLPSFFVTTTRRQYMASRWEIGKMPLPADLTIDDVVYTDETLIKAVVR
ncbi:MAG: hypothetical protein LBG99_06425 [Propionibacteriaceae bacterium]|nr:hypothetical protein [Propionibacteriaceae bacterium]